MIGYCAESKHLMRPCDRLLKNCSCRVKHVASLGTISSGFGARLHQASASMQSQRCDDTCNISLIERMESLQNGLQLHSGVTLFV